MGRLLHLTSPNMSGHDVRDLQWMLQATGDYGSVINSIYDYNTYNAVSSFQGNNSITVTGIMNSTTWTAINVTRTIPGSTPSADGEFALAEAALHIGAHEDPLGSNETAFGVWYGLNGVPWCAIFVSYCFKVGAANRVICDGFSGAGITAGKGCCYVPTVEAWARSINKFIPYSPTLLLQPGDISIYNWASGVPDHIGIVSAPNTVAGKGTFNAIEGNTSISDAGSQTDGECVRLRQRPLTRLDGVCRI